MDKYYIYVMVVWSFVCTSFERGSWKDKKTEKEREWFGFEGKLGKKWRGIYMLGKEEERGYENGGNRLGGLYE